MRKPLTAIARVCVESILGDDPMRAAMNFARARNARRMPAFWRQRWNIFYDYKVVSNADTPVSQVRRLQDSIGSDKRQDGADTLPS